MISPIPKRIEDFLTASTKYAIPPYQRNFSWGETEAEELLGDLSDYRGLSDSHLFLGNFILASPRGDTTDIIDGQQRLTSVVLLLIAARRRAVALGNRELAANIQMKLSFVDSATGRPGGHRFAASSSVKEVLEYMMSGSWDGAFPTRLGKKQVRRMVNRLRPVYRCFSTRLEKLDEDELSALLRALYSSYIVQIQISSTEEALSVFERTNARGMDLEVADLLKNHLFASQIEDIEDKWADIADKADGTLMRMLKYFYVAQRGYVQKPQLYRKLKALAAEAKPERFTDDLVSFARFYSLVRNPTNEGTGAYFDSLDLKAIAGKQDRRDAVAAALQALNQFGITQAIPVVYACVRKLMQSPTPGPDGRAKAFIRLLEGLEKYHFVNNVICERVGNEVEKLYAATCVDLSKEGDLIQVIDRFLQELLKKRASFAEFEGRFCDLTYSQETIPTICYVFDRLNNNGVDPSIRVPIYVPNPKLLRKSNNIEHWLPQQPPKGMPVDEATREAIDSIGNLLPLYFKTNSRLGNRAPAEKLDLLRTRYSKEVQHLPFVQAFIRRYGPLAKSWNSAAIAGRAKDLAREAYDEVWAL